MLPEKIKFNINYYILPPYFLKLVTQKKFKYIFKKFRQKQKIVLT